MRLIKSNYGLPEEQAGTLAEITADIGARARQSGENYVAIGQRLIDAKNILAHGEFTKWLTDEIGINHRTASRMMQVAESFKMDTVSILRPAALIELSKGNVPESAKEEAVRRANAGERVTKSVARQIVAEAKTVPGKSEPQKPAGKPSGGVTFDPSEWDGPAAEPAPEVEPRTAEDFYEGEPIAGPWVCPTPKEAAKPLDLAIRTLGEWEASVLENVVNSDEPGTAFFDERARSGFQAVVENLRGMLKTARPVAVCPLCKGERCRECRNSGLVPKRLLEMLSARAAG